MSSRISGPHSDCTGKRSCALLHSLFAELIETLILQHFEHLHIKRRLLAPATCRGRLELFDMEKALKQFSVVIPGNLCQMCTARGL